MPDQIPSTFTPRHNDASFGAAASVIIRSVGRRSLGSALASVARQTHDEIDVLVVDATGGKHPPLADRCGKFPLRLVSDGKPLKRPAAANCGLDHARGDWIIFLDDDDFFDSDHISLLIRTAVEQNARVAYAGTRLLDSGNQEIGVLNERYSHLKLCAGNFIQMGAALFHRNLLQAGCRFDEDMLLYEDWDFWLQLSMQSRFAHSAKITNNWRIQDGQSGAGLGPNADTPLQAEFVQRIKNKWQTRHSRLIRFVQHTTRRATSLLSLNRPEQAAQMLQRALRVMPNDASLTNQLGVALFRAGGVTSAWRVLVDAQALLPGNESISRNLAQVASALELQRAANTLAR